MDELNNNTSIDDLLMRALISVRAYNCLNAAGMKTIGSILNSINSPEDLLKIRNFGLKSYYELQPILKSLINKNKTASKGKDELLADLGSKMAEIITQAYNHVVELDARIGAYLKLTYPHPYDMHYAVCCHPGLILKVIDGCTYDDSLKIRDFCLCFIDIVLTELRKLRHFDVSFYFTYKERYENLIKSKDRFSIRQILDNFLSPSAREYMENLYRKSVETKLKVRARKIVHKHASTFDDFIKNADLSLNSYMDIWPGHMKKTIEEVYSFSQEMKDELYRVVRLSDEEIIAKNTKENFPFLTSEECHFVNTFKEKNAYLPAFFLLFCFLKASCNRDVKIYCFLHGLYDGNLHSLNEAALHFNLTRERIRQLANHIGTTEIPLLENFKEQNHYNWIFYLPFFSTETAECIHLKEEERVPCDINVFSSLLELACDFKRISVSDCTIFVNKNIYDNYDLKDKIKELNIIFSNKYSCDTSFHISSFVKDAPENLKDSVHSLLSYIISKIYTTDIIDDVFTLRQNSVDVSVEVYNILSQYGRPLHIDEILEELKKRFPSQSLSPYTLRRLFLSNPHIKSVKNKSVYVLDFWDIYIGGVRDRIMEILDKSLTPVHLNKIVPQVLAVVPSTNRKSIVSTINDMFANKILTKYRDNLWGLPSRTYSSEYKEIKELQTNFSFEERMEAFEDFVLTYNRFPFATGSDYETTIYRWYKRIVGGINETSEDQRSRFDKFVLECRMKTMPENRVEFLFKEKCDKYIEYIRKNDAIPTQQEDPVLFNWMKWAISKYENFTDNRRYYFDKLNSDIKTYKIQ